MTYMDKIHDLSLQMVKELNILVNDIEQIRKLIPKVLSSSSPKIRLSQRKIGKHLGLKLKKTRRRDFKRKDLSRIGKKIKPLTLDDQAESRENMETEVQADNNVSRTNAERKLPRGDS